MFKMMADSCLENKHLLIYLFIKENPVIVKLMVKQMSFRKDTEGCSGDLENIWKSKEHRAQTSQVRMTWLTLSKQ